MRHAPTLQPQPRSSVPPRLDPRVTEQRNPRSAEIDMASALEIVDIMNAEDRRVADAVAAQRTEIAQAIGYIEEAFRSGGRLFYVGAGTSGRLGILDASECPPTFSSDPDLVQGIIAGGERAVFRSQEGAEDHPSHGAAAIEERALTPRDVVVGIAASGTTPFVRGALARAREIGARAVLVACTPVDDAFRNSIDLTITAVAGPEVVTGSTRLKAGTATKMILNMLTTGAMIRTGKTFGNLMVDLRATNLKLKDRSERILVEVCDVTRDEARALLESSGGSVKLAIVMHRLQLDRAGAESALEAGGGVIRRVVGGPPPVVEA
ncbi:MAG: N-acetylmuramic acid 6-phosphate etherase [Cytophagaceae bacterium]|nr:N-acetylmuramic acid 6-phosphate etherase [Gemmatimonadaceae bacterium]